MMTAALFLALHLFTLPTIPEAIEAPADRAVYLAEHYWDNTPLSDTLVSRHAEEFERFLVDYLTIVPLLDETKQSQVLRPLFTVATPLLRRYLADEASPVAAPSVYDRALRSLSEGIQQIELHFYYKEHCDACMQTMEQLDQSVIIRRNIDDQHLAIRLHQTEDDPKMIVCNTSGECIADNINISELEKMLQAFALQQ